MKKTTNSSPYQFEGRIPLSQAIPLGLQHVMAMFILPKFYVSSYFGANLQKK